MNSCFDIIELFLREMVRDYLWVSEVVLLGNLTWNVYCIFLFLSGRRGRGGYADRWLEEPIVVCFLFKYSLICSWGYRKPWCHILFRCNDKVLIKLKSIKDFLLTCCWYCNWLFLSEIFVSNLLESHRTIHTMMVFGWTVKE